MTALILILTLSCESGPYITEIESTVVGRVDIIPDFANPQLDRTTSLAVYLPPGYDENPDKEYPVLYMLDGQNLFDLATAYTAEWMVDETLEYLVEETDFEGMIVVGIYNTEHRSHEYLPFDYHQFETGNIMKAEGQEFAAFVVETVKPYIEDNYRTWPDLMGTGIGGASFGGVMASYIALEYPEEFGLALVYSHVSVELTEEALASKPEDLHQGAVRENHRLDIRWPITDLLISRADWPDESEKFLANVQETNLGFGYTLENTFVEVDLQGSHHEETWGAWFEDSIRFLYKDFF